MVSGSRLARVSDTGLCWGMSKKQKPKKRIKPRISVTLQPETYSQLMKVRDALPGITTSSIVDELLSASLPALEDMGKALRRAFDEAGNLDEGRARDELARWAGAQMLNLMSDTENRKDSTT